MEQVSSILSNILSVEEGTTQSHPQSKTLLNRSSIDESLETLSKKPQRRSKDFDFSSFWKTSDKEQDTTNGEDRKNDFEAIGDKTSKKTLSNSLELEGNATTVPLPAPSSSSSAQYMADKLMEKVISMMISNEVVDEQTSKILQDRIEMQKQRPPLSIALMQNNSNELHRRNSDMYIFIDHVQKFFSWQDPFYTVAWLLIITHLILNPYLFTVLPLVQLITSTLVPHYLMIYPPDGVANQEYLEVNPKPSDKPLNLYKVPKPVPLFSREFFMNFTDTQNFMTLNIKLFDFTVWLTSDYLYFKNEQITSGIYVICIAMIFGNLYLLPYIVPFLLNHFIIVQLYFIFNIWAITVILHPYPRGLLLEWVYKEDTRLNVQHFVNKIEDKLTKFIVKTPTLEQSITNTDLQHATKDIGSSNEILEDNDAKYVEIYELQKLNTKNKMWEAVGFSPNFYTTNDVIRRYNSAIQELEQNDKSHTHSNEDPQEPHKLRLLKRDTLSEISPPQNYKFIPSEKWKIDYDISTWVENNLIQDLVIIDDDEKWAYDVITETNQDQKQEIEGKQLDKAINEMTMDEIEKFTDLTKSTEFFRRRRWIRKVTRMNYKDLKEESVPISSISAWV